VKPRANELALPYVASPVERLLQAAAEFDPGTPAPGLLSSGGILMLLAEDAQRRRRRTVRARLASLTGLMVGSAACSASLVMALTQSPHPVRTGTTGSVVTLPEPPKKQIASAGLPEAPATAVVAAPERKRRTVRRRRTRRPRPEAAPEAIWTEQTVEHRTTGLLADAWVLQPQADGSVELTPAIIDLPAEPLSTVDACGSMGVEAPPEPQAEPISPVPPADDVK